MITVEEACKIMLRGYSEIPYIVEIKDVGIGYYIATSYHPEELTVGNDTSLIYKDTGEKEYWFFPDHFQEIMNGKCIEVPEQYAYKKA